MFKENPQVLSRQGEKQQKIVKEVAQGSTSVKQEQDAIKVDDKVELESAWKVELKDKDKGQPRGQGRDGSSADKALAVQVWGPESGLKINCV